MQSDLVNLKNHLIKLNFAPKPALQNGGWMMCGQETLFHCIPAAHSCRQSYMYTPSHVSSTSVGSWLGLSFFK
jgi:hypothetical protein